MHRETSDESSSLVDYRENVPKRLIGEYLSTLIQHDEAIAEEKREFYALLNRSEVTFQ